MHIGRICDNIRLDRGFGIIPLDCRGRFHEYLWVSRIRYSMVYMEYAKIGKESDMLLMIILILLVGLMVGSIESNLREAFNDPEWIDIKDWEYRL